MQIINIFSKYWKVLIRVFHQIRFLCVVKTQTLLWNGHKDKQGKAKPKLISPRHFLNCVLSLFMFLQSEQMRQPTRRIEMSSVFFSGDYIDLNKKKSLFLISVNKKFAELIGNGCNGKK